MKSEILALDVYVACCLTYAGKRYKERIFKFKDELRKVPWVRVLDFVTVNSVQVSPNKAAIYENDIHGCVGVAKAIVAEVTLPATGLGWELGTAVEKHGIPVILCHKEDAKISNLIIGAALHELNKGIVKLKTYKKSFLEILPALLIELELIHQMNEQDRALLHA